MSSLQFWKMQWLSLCIKKIQSLISETIVQYHLTLCIPKKLDEANMDCGNFVDLQKVSKTVEYGILLSKLENHGIRGLSNEWPTSSLPN